MDILFEILFDFAVEGTIELGTNIKVPKFIRYPALILMLLFFMGVTAAVFVLGIALMKDDLFFGILMIIFGTFLLVGIIVRGFRFFKRKRSHRGDNLE